MNEPAAALGSEADRSRPQGRTRTVRPLPPRSGEDADASPAATWWGTAWVRALEESAADSGRLARGRAYARAGHVGAVTVAPGRIAAPVRGSRARPYRVVLRLGVPDDEEWSALLDVLAADSASPAAPSERRMPRALVEAAESAGVGLLPRPGEPDPGCSCPDSGRPCKHAAALCYQVAWLLDADPFLLLVARGRGEEELSAGLSRRGRPSPAASAEAAEPDTALPTPSGAEGDLPYAEQAESGPRVEAGPLARDALATRVRLPLPEPLDLPPEPSLEAAPVIPLPPEPPGGSGGHGADALPFLAVNAALRAHDLLRTARPAKLPQPADTRHPPDARDAPAAHPTDPDAGPETDSGADSGTGTAGEALWHDAVRLAATHPALTGRATFSARFAELADACGRTAPELARAAAAWRQGHRAGLGVLESEWQPPAGDFDRARGALAAAALPRTSIGANHLTDPTRTVQLRYGRDGRWYPYRRGPGGEGDWWPDGPAGEDPVAVMAQLLDGVPPDAGPAPG